ncbi:MAG: phage tail tape measure protein [Faecousia sp.]
MGERTIDTILRVQNESGYKTALKNCTSELKVLKSELDKVTSDFRSNANSMEALTKKGEVMTKMYDTQQQKVELLRGAMQKAQDTRDAEEQTVSDLRAQYDQAKKALASLGDTVDETSEEYQQQKAEVDKLRDAIIQNQAKLDASTRSYQYYATQLNKAEIELSDLGEEQEKINRLLEEAKQSADGCAPSIDRYGDAVRESGGGTEETTSAVEAMASAMVASGIKQKVEDLAAAMMECSEASQTFELSLAQVSTIADASVVPTQAMREGILQLSTDLRKDANEVAGAFYNALSAGVDTANVLDFTAKSSKLATAGFTDTATAVDVLTTILNAYKLEADQTEKVASTLVRTQDLGKVTVDQLGKVMGRVIPSAAAYGVNLDNIAAAYANMTAAGINAENSTTYLATMLDELADSGSSVAAVLQKQTGKSFSELMADGRSLGDVLDIIGSSVEYDNVQFSNLWSSATAGKAALSLVNGGAYAFNKTLLEMSNSSGAVEKNYKKMTEVSEYSSQRLKVSCNNLKIAVGDQLNPVLDRIRETGAGVLEKATEAVSKNPAIVAAISGTVTALGLLAGGLAALTAAEAVATAMTKLNISLAANPAALVAVAIAGVVAALGTYVAQIETTQDKVDALTESARNLSETVEAGNASYEDAVISADAAVSTVNRYIDRLKELEAQGLKTDEQQLEYSMILDKINGIMPGLNAELDVQTGLVKGGADALRDQAEAWKENAIAEAAYTRYKSEYDALADAMYEVNLNQARLNVLERENQPTKDRLAQVTKELSDAQDRLNNATVAGSAYLGASSREQMEARQQVDALTAEYNALQAQMVDINAEEGILRLAIEEGNQTIASCRTEVEAADEAYKNLAESLQTASDGATEGAAGMAGSVGESLQTLRDAYDELYGSAKDSLDKQIGLFDDLSGKCENSTEDMIKNLKSQITAFDNYSANIQLALERGIDVGLVQKLSDGSTQSMQILAELVTATDDQIAELNAAFDQSEAAKENAATTMSAVEKAYSDGLEKISSSWFDQWKQIGEHCADGLIAGQNSRKSAINASAGRLAYASQMGYKEASQINSPSKKWMWLAEQEVAAPLQVYRQAVPKMEAQARELSDAGYLGAILSKQAVIPSLVSAASAIPAGSDNSKLYLLLQQILAGVQAGKKLVLYPDVLVGETVDSYDAALGQNKMLSDRGAK